MQVWQTVHYEDLYPYHDQRVKFLEPGNPDQCMNFCHWTTHPQLLLQKQQIPPHFNIYLITNKHVTVLTLYT
jgi:hypothetical protein